MPDSEQLNKDQCQHCGEQLKIGHNCNGLPFVSVSPQNSVPAVGARLEILGRKGFRQTSNQDGPYYYHPMYGLVAIYPGGAFRIACAKTALPLDAHLESLMDSGYTEVQEFGQTPYQTRCDACGGVGRLFPNQRDPFPHEPNCPQRGILGLIRDATRRVRHSSLG